MFFVYALTIVILGAWAIKSIALGQKIFKRSFLDIPLLLFFLSQFISTIFSVDVHTSLWGYYSRGNGGLLSLVAYCSLYWAYVSNMGARETKQAIKYILASGLILSLWGILEHFGASPSCALIRNSFKEFNDGCWVQDVQSRVFATLGQPNWLAAWIVAVAPLAWAKLSDKQKEISKKIITFDNKTLIYILISVATLMVTLYTKSRSGVLGFAVAFVVFASLYFIKTKNWKNLLLIACLLSLVAITTGTPWTKGIGELTHITPQPSSGQQAVGTSLETGGTESGNIRKIVWEGAINIWRAYPIFGSGVETFGFSYYNFRPLEHNTTSEWELLYNKAHNEYLNYLANTGLIGLGTYLLLIGSFVFFALKNLKLKIKNSENEILQNNITTLALLAGYASILVTNFFGFSVVTVHLLFFLYPAMAMVLSEPETSNKQEVTRNLSYKQIAGVTILSLFACFILLRIFQIWHADILYTASQSSNNRGLEGEAFIKIRKALDTRPDEPLYYDQLAKVSSALAVTENAKEDATQSAKFASLARDASDVALNISPRNLALWKSQAIMYQRLALVDPSYLKDAVAPLQQAIKLAPTDPKVRYNLGVIYQRLGQLEDARKILEEAVNLKPDYYDARVGLAKVYVELKQPGLAREQYQWVLDHLNSQDQEVIDALKNLNQ